MRSRHKPFFPHLRFRKVGHRDTAEADDNRPALVLARFREGAGCAQVDLAGAAVDEELVKQRAADGKIRVALRGVSDDKLVAPGGVGEEKVDALFRHQPVGEVVVALAVLHAVVARVVLAFEPEVGAVDGAEHFFEYFLHRLLLEEAAPKNNGMGESEAAGGGGDDGLPKPSLPKPN